MVKINNINKIIQKSLAIISDDYTEMWLVITIIQEENPELSFVELIEATKRIVQELVEKNNVLILNEDTQEPMNLNINEILQLIEDRFKILGRIPNIGDGVWFTV